MLPEPRGTEEAAGAVLSGDQVIEDFADHRDFVNVQDSVAQEGQGVIPDRQNERLRNEVSVLHSQLDHEREEHEELRDALRSKPKEVKVRKSGFVRVVLIGGGAYLLGAHAGRERYDEVLRWARSMRDRMRGTAEDMAIQVDAGASKLEDRVEKKMADAELAASRRTSQLPNTVRS